MTGRVFEDKELDFHRIMLKRSLRMIEATLRKTPFLCGNEMSIADLSAACELDQVHFIDLKLDKWPNTKLWLHKMVDEQPGVNEMSQQMRKLAAMAVKK